MSVDRSSISWLPPSSAWSRAAWTQRFVARIAARAPDESPSALALLAQSLWPLSGHLPPERVAEIEYAQWPPALGSMPPAGDVETVQGFAARRAAARKLPGRHKHSMNAALRVPRPGLSWPAGHQPTAP